MILVFAGAGASKGVDPNGYPTTEQFFQQLPSDISESPLFAGLVEYIQHKLSTEVIDIEQWLWAAIEAKEVFSALRDNATAAGWLFGQNRVNAMVGSNVDLQAPVRVGEMVLQRLEQLEDKIYRLIYQLYRVRPSPDALKASWIPFLKSVLAIDPHVELFTTNYDVVLEEAISLAGLPIETGRTGGTYSVLNEALWTDADTVSYKTHGRLTKLHGSVDWSKLGDDIYFGTPRFQGNHSDQVIIYPGFKGVPTERPFTLFHEHFSRCVENARGLIFIGFAFRDQYINQVLMDRLHPDAQFVVINPSELPDAIPVEQDRVSHIKHGFSGKISAQTQKALVGAIS